MVNSCSPRKRNASPLLDASRLLRDPRIGVARRSPPMRGASCRPMVFPSWKAGDGLWALHRYYEENESLAVYTRTLRIRFKAWAGHEIRRPKQWVVLPTPRRSRCSVFVHRPDFRRASISGVWRILTPVQHLQTQSNSLRTHSNPSRAFRLQTSRPDFTVASPT